MGVLTAAASVKYCFEKGYTSIDWLCVDSNKGSIAIAEKLGFTLNNFYYSFSSYPPIENFSDLSEKEWLEWGLYLENASSSEECLIWECLNCYIKANEVTRTINIMSGLRARNININFVRFKNFIALLQGHGMCTNFSHKIWSDFINSAIE